MSDKAQIFHPSAIMRQEPDFSSETSNELLFGETVSILEDHGEFALVENEFDGYEGFMHRDTLSNDIFEPTHKVSAMSAYLYSAPDFKSPPLGALPFQSRIKIEDTNERENDFIKTAHNGWVFYQDINELDVFSYNFVEVAKQFLHAPYLWGGRTAAGLDCSALVQLSMMACGIDSCPRDTTEQQEELGESVPFASAADLKALQAGDLVYFPRHVGIMIDNTRILNATSRHMRVVIEDLFDLIGVYGEITAVRRVSND